MAEQHGTPDPMIAGTQMWEAGYRSLMEGWKQAQEFWNSSARSWGEMAGAWAGQTPAMPGVPPESMAVVRELQDAAFNVGMAWMRLPLTMAGGAQPGELQEAITRLTEAQGRAFHLWLEALGRMGQPS